MREFTEHPLRFGRSHMEVIRDVAGDSVSARLRMVVSNMSLSGSWLGGHGFLGKYTDDAGAVATTAWKWPNRAGCYIAYGVADGSREATVSIGGIVVDTIEKTRPAYL